MIGSLVDDFADRLRIDGLVLAAIVGPESISPDSSFVGLLYACATKPSCSSHKHQ